MKVLIITMTCGEGHNSMAKAFQDKFQSLNIEAKTIQLYGYSKNKEEKENKTFLNAGKYVPHIYNLIWNSLLKSNYKPKVQFFLKSRIRDCSNYILEEINNYNPNAVLITHTDASAVVADLKRKNLINQNIKIFGVIPDYCCCPGSSQTRWLDYVFVPNEDVKNEMIKMGTQAEKIFCCGIPIQPKFLALPIKDEQKEEIYAKYDLNKNLFTITLFSGGNCASPNLPLVKKLIKSNLPIQIICISGKNQKQFNLVENYIKKHNIKNVCNLGFCTEIEKVFSVTNVVFSRGGASSITEAFVSGVPIIFREGLITNEKINEELFVSKGYALSLKKIKNAPKIINSLIQDKTSIYPILKENVKTFPKLNTTQIACDIICQKCSQ